MSNKGIIIAVSAIVIAVVAITAAVVITNNNGNNNTTESGYTAVFDPNVVISTADQYKIIRQEPNTMIYEASAPTRAECEFLGWYMDKDCTQKAVFPYKLTGNVRFYAKWTEPAVTSYFNQHFFSDTEYGRYLVDSHKETTGAEEVKPLGASVTSQYVAKGLTMIVFRIGTDYKVFDLADFSTEKFTIPGTDVISVTVYDKITCNHEFIEVETDDGYYVYDTNGNKFGPSVYRPIVLLNSMIDLGKVCYKFNSDSTIEKYFDISSKYRPESGDVYVEDSKRTYSVIDTIVKDGKTVKNAYLLDNRFNLLKTYSFPEGSEYCRFISVGSGNYLYQYAKEVSSDSKDVSFIDGGKSYKLTSQIVNSSGKSMDTRLTLPAITPTNLNYSFGIKAYMAEDIKNIISFYTIDPNTKEIQKDGKILTSLNSDGTIYKIFILSVNDYNFSSILPLVNTNYVRVWYTDVVDGKNIAHENILDPVGKKLILNDVHGTRCMKYFIKNSKLIPDDYNIYDVNGKIVGSYSGKVLAGSTHNNLFFSDDAGKMYIFRDGSMTELTDYKGDFVSKYSVYGYKTGEGEYKFYTENGTFITKCISEEVREVTSLYGENLIEFNTGKIDGLSVFTTYIITTE